MKSRTPHPESGVFGGGRQRIPPFIFRLFFQISIIRASIVAERIVVDITVNPHFFLLRLLVV